MRKIPTLFERDWTDPRRPIVDEPNPACAWVFAGEGSATRKWDGTCCMVRAGRLWKRRELRDGEAEPAGFEVEQRDAETGNSVGWVPVGSNPLPGPVGAPEPLHAGTPLESGSDGAAAARDGTPATSSRRPRLRLDRDGVPGDWCAVILRCPKYARSKTSPSQGTEGLRAR